MKTHALLEGTVGLFENNITACGAAGTIIEGDVLVHHQTRAHFVLAQDFPTCKPCQWYLEDHYA